MENFDGKILMNCWRIVKFVNIFPSQNFAPYGIHTVYKLPVMFIGQYRLLPVVIKLMLKLIYGNISKGLATTV